MPAVEPSSQKRRHYLPLSAPVARGRENDRGGEGGEGKKKRESRRRRMKRRRRRRRGLEARWLQAL
jgi:hypothetical protein